MKILKTQSTPVKSENHQSEKVDMSEKGIKKVDDRIKRKAPPIHDRAEIMSKIQSHKEGQKIDMTPRSSIPQDLEETQQVDKKDKSNNSQMDEKDHLLHSNIGKNNPTDPATQEKLRSILRTGAFRFSDKEKNVLSRILNS